MRIIESHRREPTVSEAEAEAIMEAISRGTQIVCYDSGGVYHESRGASVTRFTRPDNDETAWATEVWTHTTRWVRDFPTEAEALAYYERTLDRLGI